MTREEAKKQIYDLKQYLNRSTAWYLNDKHKTALDMALSALSENKGEWILDETDNSVECNKCGCQIYPNDISHGEPHFCPNCGADMRGGKE